MAGYRSWRFDIGWVFVAPHVEIDARTGVNFIIFTFPIIKSTLNWSQGSFLNVLLHNIMVKQFGIFFYYFVGNLSTLWFDDYWFARCYTISNSVTTLIHALVYSVSQDLRVLLSCIFMTYQSFCWWKMPIHFRLNRVHVDHILSNGVGKSLGATHLDELVHNLIKFILNILRHSIELGVLQENRSLLCIMRLLKISRLSTGFNNANPLFLFLFKLESLAE